jgi:hypothetical protein
MSIVATKWALDQPERFPDMKPNEVMVLFVMGDCHNPVNGCFPSHEYIARKTNLSERAIRDILGRLQERGLVDWQKQRDAGRQGKNRYSLAFEADFVPAAPRAEDQAEETAASVQAADEDAQPADSETFRRQNLPPYKEEPEIEPESEPERERARERKARFQDQRKRLFMAWRHAAGEDLILASSIFETYSDSDRETTIRRVPVFLENNRAVGRKIVRVSLPDWLTAKAWQFVPDPPAAKPDVPAVPTIEDRTLQLFKRRPCWVLFERIKAGNSAGAKHLAELIVRTGYAICQLSEVPSQADEEGLARIDAHGPAATAWRAHLRSRYAIIWPEPPKDIPYTWAPSEWPPDHAQSTEHAA